MSSKKQRVCSQRQVHLTSRLGSAGPTGEGHWLRRRAAGRRDRTPSSALCSQDPLGARTLREVRSQCAAPAHSSASPRLAHLAVKEVGEGRPDVSVLVELLGSGPAWGQTVGHEEVTEAGAPAAAEDAPPHGGPYLRRWGAELSLLLRRREPRCAGSGAQAGSLSGVTGAAAGEVGGARGRLGTSRLRRPVTLENEEPGTGIPAVSNRACPVLT